MFIQTSIYMSISDVCPLFVDLGIGIYWLVSDHGYNVFDHSLSAHVWPLFCLVLAHNLERSTILLCSQFRYYYASAVKSMSVYS